MNRWWGKVAALALSMAVCAQALTPVEEHGALKVSGAKVLDAQGKPAQLVGMSLFWSGWSAPFYSRKTVHWLAYDWKISVIRCAMGVEGGGNYLDTNNGAAKNIRMVDSVIKASIDLGIYVIIDWHDHNAPNHQERSIEFFQKMARKWGTYPNVIYEIYNEPHGKIDANENNGTMEEEPWSWADSIKPYSQAVVDSIRAIDPDNLILIGNESWDQNPAAAIKDPVKGTNLLYTLHFYGGSHKFSGALGTNAKTCVANRVPLFISEWGTSDALGGGEDKKIYLPESQAWLDWAKTNSISWCNWSVVNKDESSAALKPTANPLGGWTADDLSASGTWVRSKILEINDKYTFPEPPPPPVRKPDTTLLPGRIQAEGYLDFKGVQFESSSDEDGSDDLGWVEAGDWVDFMVNVPADGQYNLHVRTASNTNGGDFVLQDAAGKELKRVTTPGTMGWQNWVTVTDTTGVSLKAGTQKLRVVFEGGTGGLFNLNWFELNHEAVPLRSKASWKRSAMVSLREGKITVQDATGFERVQLRDPSGRVLSRSVVVDGKAELAVGTAKGLLIAELTGPSGRELHSLVRAR